MENITIGDLSHALLFAVAFIGAIEFLALRARKYIKATMKDEIAPIKKEIANIKEELNENSLNTMKNTICNETIPLSERVSIGKKYIDKGGNGAVKIYLNQLEARYDEELKNEANK